MTMQTTTSVRFFSESHLETRHGVLFEERKLSAARSDLVMSHDADDAILISLRLEDGEAPTSWRRDEHSRTQNAEAGTLIIVDLSQAQTISLEGRYHALHIRLPKKLLRDVAQGVRADVAGMERPWGTPFDDATIEALGHSVLSDLRRGRPLGGMFLDHLALALASHVAQAHGHAWGLTPAHRGGMAPWQTRRAQEFLTQDLAHEACLKQAAKLCGLSLSHFSRTFRQSFGVSPHQWRTQRRVEKAQNLLQASRGPLSEIALACGFADQSHFTRAFTREVGQSPGAWRRAMDAASWAKPAADDIAADQEPPASRKFLPIRSQAHYQTANAA